MRYQPKRLLLRPAELSSPENEPLLLQPGLPPTWSALQRGQFLERPLVFDSLRQSFETWRGRVKDSTAESSPALFCITGESGQGKSALLLQLAATLLRDGVAAELLLDEAAHGLERFEQAPPTKPLWYFIDQLPSAIHGPVGESWIKALRQQRPRFIVTTASAATLNWLTTRYPKGFEWAVWNLPPLSEAEAQTFADGVNGGRVLWQEGMTLEAFLLKLSHSRLLGQAADDVQTLAAFMADDSLALAWAANALGLAAPVSLLKEKNRPIAKRLSVAGLLPAHTAVDGVRLASPGLALPAFVARFPDPAFRMHQVAKGFAQLLDRWLEDKEPALASWFLRGLFHSEYLGCLLANPGNRADLRSLRKNFLRELYYQHRLRHGERPALDLLSAWMDIGLNFRLHPDSVEDAAFTLETAPSSLSPELVADIWLHGDYRKNPLAERIRTAATTYFRRCKAEMAESLCRLVVNTGHKAEAFPLLLRWVEANPDDPACSKAFAALMEARFGTCSVLAWAKDWLDGQLRNKTAAMPLAVVLGHQPESKAIRQRAMRWLSIWGEASEAGPVVSSLLLGGLGEVDAIHAALIWTARHPLDPHTDKLWDLLLKHYLGHPHVGQIAREWIKSCPSHPKVCVMILAVLRNAKQDSAFAAQVLLWIADNADHDQTPAVLEALVRWDLETVRNTCGLWLDAHPNHPRAARVLTAVINSRKAPARWFQRAETFVKANKHPETVRVLIALLALPSNDTALLLAKEFLPKASPEDQKQVTALLAREAGRNKNKAAQIIEGQLTGVDFTAQFCTELVETLWNLPTIELNAWVEQSFKRLGEEEQQRLFEPMLARSSPLPTCLSLALADWLQRNARLERYQQATRLLRRYPAQGRYFHSASLLPLRILADISGPPE